MCRAERRSALRESRGNMALNVKLALYRGTKTNLASLASTGQAGVLAYATDTQEVYVDSGSGTGIGPGNAWLRVAGDNAVQTAANQAARLALSNVLLGDLCVQTDTGVTYLCTALPSSTNGNWTAIGIASVPVTSVNTQTGAVVLTLDNIGDGPTTYARQLVAAMTQGEYDLAKSSQLGFTPDNLIQPSTIPAHATSHAYTKGQCVQDPTNAGKVQQCVIAGTSAGSAPSFSNTEGATTVDGGATFENIGRCLLVSVAYAASATSHSFVTYIDSSGTVHVAQPAFSDISSTLAQSQLPASIGSGSNLALIDCGTF